MATFSVVNQPAQVRKMRSPSHTWYLKQRPWQIQPFMIAPVLPGETLENALFQATVVSDPIANSLIGWWCEHYLFYVKLRDLTARQLFTQMLLKPETDLTSLDGATDVKYYHYNGATTPAINYPLLCVQSIVDNYFRHENETYATASLNGMYTAGVNVTTALDSAINNASLVNAANVDQNLISAVAGQGDATTAVWTSEIDKAMREYDFARQNKITDMTFEDWCEQFGIKMPVAELFKPELIRYSKSFTHPSNTIDPTTGAARSAVFWKVQERVDKKRFFKEPGFIVGICVIRPKVFFGNMRSHFTVLMKDAYSWLPRTLAADPMASFVKMVAGDGPLNSNTDGYWVDMKDLFVHGDQFVNFDIAAAAGINRVALPNAALDNKRYPASTDADGLFVDTTAGIGMVKQDGICTLHIKGLQEDTSPMSIGTNIL